MRKTNPLLEHRSNVDLYKEVSRLAAAGFPAPLTAEERDAYSLLPSLIESCRESYAAIPLEDPQRPMHYLMA